MRTLATVAGLGLVVGTLWDFFETIILPRTPQRKLRLTRFFYLGTWKPWSVIGRRLPEGSIRESFLSYFGPLSLIVLLGTWAIALMTGFGLLHWGLRTPLSGVDGPVTFVTTLYLSGETFFTLGYGDVTPNSAGGRFLAVLEAGMGFSFLAIVIGYLPVIFQGFAQRELDISLLDEHAGSPPSAGELLRRHGMDGTVSSLDQFLHEWERWAANVLESHLSYPTLAYWRSQHENQSWLAALTMILDACSLILVGVDGAAKRQARLTFAMARHTVVDLAQIFDVSVDAARCDRLPPDHLAHLRDVLVQAHIELDRGPEADAKLAELRAMYEPYVWALADFLLLPLPPWVPEPDASDNWQDSEEGRVQDLQSI